MNLGELKKDMEELGEKAFRATQVYEWIHVKLVQSFDEMTNISEKLKEKLIINEKYYDGSEEKSFELVEKEDVQNTAGHIPRFTPEGHLQLPNGVEIW